MKKRILSLLLASLLGASVLAGCSNNSANPAETDNPVQTNVQTPSSDGGAEEEEELSPLEQRARIPDNLPENNFDGREFTVCTEERKFYEIFSEDLNGEAYGASYGRAYIREAMQGLTAEGESAGYVVRVTSSDGFDGDITLVVGIDPEGVVSGIDFTELNETPGMGMRCAEPAFKDQFNNRDVTRFKLNKSGASDNSDDGIDAVSGASISSGAVVNAVNAGLDFFHSVIKEGN